MPRISKIQLDTSVEKNDKILGSNAGGATKNFEIKDISKFFKHTNAAGIGGQLVYQYSAQSLSSGQMTLTFSSGTTFQNATSLKISKYIYNDDATKQNLLNLLSNATILIANFQDQNKFGLYTTGTITVDSNDSNFYNITLAVVTANGEIEDLDFYSISNIAGPSDKHVKFESYYEENTATNPWVVTHNLNKFPSVTVVNRNGVEVYAKVTHDTNNQVTITFSGDTAGKAYFN